MRVSDEDLKAYLAGELGAEDAARIETAMLADPELERRLMALDRLSAHVREAMSALPDDARIERIMAAAAPEAQAAPAAAASWRWAGVAAALLVGIGLGWGGSQFGAPQADWRVEVAHYQALYTGETLNGINVSPGELDAQIARVAAMTGADLPRERLAAVNGMELLRAQALGFSDTPLAQIVYRGEGGAPIALCLIRTGADRSETQVATLQGLASASWAANGVEFLLIGGDDADWIASRAAEIRAALGDA